MQAPTAPICAIVRLLNGVQHPAVRFQVVLRPDQCTAGYIRLGNTPEDELNGWFKLDDLYLEHILGRATKSGENPTRWSVVPTLEEVLAQGEKP